jgi:hypothetical protein
MQRPLIAVSADIDEFPTAFGNMDCFVIEYKRPARSRSAPS